MSTSQRIKLVSAAGLFVCTMSLQAAGLSAPIRPCCAAKQNPSKSDATVTDKKRRQRPVFTITGE